MIKMKREEGDATESFGESVVPDEYVVFRCSGGAIWPLVWLPVSDLVRRERNRQLNRKLRCGP